MMLMCLASWPFPASSPQPGPTPAEEALLIGPGLPLPQELTLFIKDSQTSCRKHHPDGEAERVGCLEPH